MEQDSRFIVRVAGDCDLDCDVAQGRGVILGVVQINSQPDCRVTAVAEAVNDPVATVMKYVADLDRVISAINVFEWIFETW